MKFSTALSPHVQPVNSVTRVMFEVIVALVPGVIALVWFFGLGVLINVVLAVITALMAESLVLLVRGRPVWVSLKDLSAVVTAVLLAISLPAIAPWWVTVTGILFAIVIAKHLYGGLGYNPFNPAMVGYVFLLVSFPLPMTSWPAVAGLGTMTLNFQDIAQLIFFERIPENADYDALTMATPLDALKTQLSLQKTVLEAQSGAVFGYLAGKGWEWVSLAYLLGGLWLMVRKIINWHIPVGLILGISVISGICYLIDAQLYAPPVFHLFAGATMLGAFFIATDPVTAATTVKGRLIYGMMIGVLVYIIRVWGGYPDAVAFSVLLANLAAPALDYFTKPRVFGHRA
ncbi:electron transport complex subunit RsxD [Methylicorpusculum oleiharenae]|uniref:electron transport complex subunit RsxD n=1 Tax=Methylicorpusculum oleiharenae TaxID=1338687 RepID=UPI00135B6998|nr:electron transport complex subunit RsxD [Methylicorpusculum oleiharenae]MCD2449947.1 electron transport complex subunit RsxD [Methylicorpusculum oleiharenae]